MADYRKYLGKKDELTAPWLGGDFVHDAQRRLRVAARPERFGWYRFEVKSRLAHAVSETEPSELTSLPAVRGHFWNEQLVVDGAKAVPLFLRPEEEPAQFAPLTTRRWHDGSLLFHQLDFESEVEGQARALLAEGAALTGLKGVPATLRAAWVYALASRTSQRLNINAVPAELKPFITRIADGGVAAAETALRALGAERLQANRELAELRQRQHAELLRDEVQRARATRQGGSLEERLLYALESAGAQLESHRRAGEGRVEVVFRFHFTRFISIVDEATLQVIDSGICLGHPPRDDLVTLESLPSVIQEAMETDALVILRHP